MKAEPTSVLRTRRLLYVLALLAGGLLIYGGVPGNCGEAFGQETESVAEAPAGEGEEAAAEPAREGGFCLNPFWLFFVVVCAAVWLYLTAWVSEDAEGVGAAPAKWASVVLVAGGVGFVCVVLLHAAFGFLMLVFVGAAFSFYLVERNRALPLQQKLLGQAHRSALVRKLKFWQRAPAEAGEGMRSSFALRRADGKTLEGLVNRRGELVEAAMMAARCVTRAVQMKGQALQVDVSSAGAAVRIGLDGLFHELETLERDLTPELLQCLRWLSGDERKSNKAALGGNFHVDVPGQEPIEVKWRIRRSPTRRSIVLSFPDWTSDMYKEGLVGLGMHRPMAERIEKIVGRDRGVVLVSGPPGSGVTTTLYALVRCVRIVTTDVLSIEERMEHDLDQVRRMTVKPSGDETFEKVYELAMREEPNVLLFGELKEPESTQKLLEFAKKQGLLLSSVKAGRSADALVHLAAMGIDYRVLATSVVCVINQRLVRKLCTFCREAAEPDPALLRRLKIDAQNPGTWFKPVGCERCLGTGFSGRTGVFEMLVMTDPVRDLLVRGAEGGGKVSAQAINKAAGSRALRTLEVEGLLKVKEGITTLAEIRRCLSPQ